MSLIGIAITIQVHAQRSGGFSAPDRNNVNPDSPEFGEDNVVDDTLDVQYYYLDIPERLEVFQDTFVQYFHEYKPTAIRKDDYFNLGLPGSATRPVIPSLYETTGFQLGLHQFDPYRIDNHSFRFYELRKALTTVYYTQGQSQEDGVFKARFARNFRDGIQLSIDYNRYNNLGLYNRQVGRNTNLGIGLKYESKNGKLNIAGTHFSNIYDQNSNGGITTDTLFNLEFYDQRTAIPINLEGADIRDQEKIYQLVAQYKLAGKDSTATEEGIKAEYRFRAENRSYKFADQSSPLDTTYYGELLTDNRGIRHFVENRRIVNDFNLNFNQANGSKNITLGLRNRINRINQEPLLENLTEWIAHGRLRWTVGDRLGFDTRAELNINKDNASYLVNGNLNLDLKKAGKLQGSININQRPPSLIENGVWLSQTNIWDNDFKSIFTNHLTATYSLDQYHFYVTGGQILGSNMIYFTENTTPFQESSVTTLSYLKIYKQFKVGKIYNENKIVLQATGNNQVFRVPSWYTHHSLYFFGPLFKKVLNLKTGFELRINETYEGMTYSPVIGQFRLDDKFDIPLYPSLDFHTSLRVRYFRAFVLLENILAPLRDDVYFQTSRYPQNDLTLRIGLSWIFIN